MLLEWYLYLLVNQAINRYKKSPHHDFYFVIASFGSNHTYSKFATCEFITEKWRSQEIVHIISCSKTKWERYGLKAQKHIAQGSALGKCVTCWTPCKGKSMCNTMITRCFCPYRAQAFQRILAPGCYPGLRAFGLSARRIPHYLISEI